MRSSHHSCSATSDSRAFRALPSCRSMPTRLRRRRRDRVGRRNRHRASAAAALADHRREATNLVGRSAEACPPQQVRGGARSQRPRTVATRRRRRGAPAGGGCRRRRREPVRPSWSATRPMRTPPSAISAMSNRALSGTATNGGGDGVARIATRPAFARRSVSTRAAWIGLVADLRERLAGVRGGGGPEARRKASQAQQTHRARTRRAPDRSGHRLSRALGVGSRPVCTATTRRQPASSPASASSRGSTA